MNAFELIAPNTIVSWNGKRGLGGAGPVRIAGFDLDHTLIRPKGRNKFPRDGDDWQWMQDNVAERIKVLLAAGDVNVVVFTNQRGLSNDTPAQAEWTRKILTLQSILGNGVSWYAAMGKDRYRKPMTGMWEECVRRCGGAEAVDIEGSFQVGDAAGRRGDFSAGDAKFARNAGVRFWTPEMYFGGEAWADTPIPQGLDLARYVGPTEYRNYVGETGRQEVILMMAFPGSGKSQFAKQLADIGGQVVVSYDDTGSKAKTMRAFRDAVAAGKSVIVDNTNTTPKSRAEFVGVARDMGVPHVRVIEITNPLSWSQHMNQQRVQIGERATIIPDVAQRTFRKNQVAVNPETEGIDAIDRVENHVADVRPEYYYFYDEFK